MKRCEACKYPLEQSETGPLCDPCAMDPEMSGCPFLIEDPEMSGIPFLIGENK